ncbi:MAG: PDDEXK nuclease domain-containing protein [Cyanobacteria bacterium J06627_28]
MSEKDFSLSSSTYQSFLSDLKKRIQTAQSKAVRSVNRELVLLYWQIGSDILQRQETAGWGSKVIGKLSEDLRQAFPDMKGFSPRNLKYMRTFAESWPDQKFVQEVLAQIPWYHNITLLEKIKDHERLIWYVQKTVENGWSRNVLVHQIESRLWERQGKAVSNFAETLPSPQSDLAQQTLKDPYVFDFLTLTDDYNERELENGLVEHVTQFLLELGAGFAYVGRQVLLQVGDQDFFVDLLFYHTHLHCYVVIELKVGDFKPEYAGKLNFYLKAVDELMRKSGDAQTIGLLLCKKRDRLVAEWALSDVNKPIGISEYEITRDLPEEIKGSLPSIEEIEAELMKGE